MRSLKVLTAVMIPTAFFTVVFFSYTKEPRWGRYLERLS